MKICNKVIILTLFFINHSQASVSSEINSSESSSLPVSNLIASNVLNLKGSIDELRAAGNLLSTFRNLIQMESTSMTAPLIVDCMGDIHSNYLACLLKGETYSEDRGSFIELFEIWGSQLFTKWVACFSAGKEPDFGVYHLCMQTLVNDLLTNKDKYNELSASSVGPQTVSSRDLKKRDHGMRKLLRYLMMKYYSLIISQSKGLVNAKESFLCAQALMIIKNDLSSIRTSLWRKKQDYQNMIASSDKLRLNQQTKITYLEEVLDRLAEEDSPSIAHSVIPTIKSLADGNPSEKIVRQQLDELIDQTKKFENCIRKSNRLGGHSSGNDDEDVVSIDGMPRILVHHITSILRGAVLSSSEYIKKVCFSMSESRRSLEELDQVEKQDSNLLSLTLKQAIFTKKHIVKNELEFSKKTGALLELCEKEAEKVSREITVIEESLKRVEKLIPDGYDRFEKMK